MYNKNRFLFDLQGTACKTTAFCLSPGQGRFDVLPATAFCCLVLDAFFIWYYPFGFQPVLRQVKIY